MTTQPEPPPAVPPQPPAAPPPKPPFAVRRLVIGIVILVGFLSVYILSLVGVHTLTKSASKLPDVDLSKYHQDDTIVALRLEELKTVANRLTVNVLVYPEDSLYDEKMGILTSDVAVRLYPENDLGDMQYPKGKAPGQVSTTIEAHGDPGNWPFDTYTTDEISGLVFTGGYHERVWARMEATGQLDGWDVTVKRVHDSADTDNPNSLDNVVVTFHRSKGPLIFDLGIVLVLISLPTLALLVAVPMALGRTTFLPPFSTWYAAMLFAIVPLRNFLPGSPPPGSWVDQAVVLWVLIALVVAMGLFIVAWVRQRDRRDPKKT
jgi:hypothetical protein